LRAGASNKSDLNSVLQTNKIISSSSRVICLRAAR
jgi:hypothetical protein